MVLEVLTSEFLIPLDILRLSWQFRVGLGKKGETGPLRFFDFPHCLLALDTFPCVPGLGPHLFDGTVAILDSTTENSRWVRLLLPPRRLTSKLIMLSTSQWGVQFFTTIHSSPHSVGEMFYSSQLPSIFSGCSSPGTGGPGKEEGSGKTIGHKAMVFLSVMVRMG